jgi:hypothetical protein
MTAIFLSTLAIQHLLVVLDPLLTRVLSGGDKKLAFRLISTFAGLALVWECNIGVLGTLGISDDRLLDTLITGLFIGSGTDGLDSVLKVVGYSKMSKSITLPASSQNQRGQIAKATDSDVSSAFQ